MSKLSKIRQIKARCKSHDKVYTPLAVAMKLVNMCEIEETDIVLYPSKGINGVFFKNLPPCVKRWCEMDEGVDFFEFHEPVDVVIGSPL